VFPTTAPGYSLQALPSGITGLNVYYQGGYLSNLSSDLATILTPRTILTSFDLEPAGQAYGATWLQTSQAGSFDARQEVVSPSQIQSTANQDGVQSRVITAVSFDASGQANLFSYGWQGDTTTLYESQTVLAAPQDIASSATQLAAEGYIITAFGGDSTNGFVLVGTRVQGDNLPRPIHIQTLSSDAFSAPGWSIVARADYSTPVGSPTPTGNEEITVFEQ
jgi:hypothetical protein